MATVVETRGDDGTGERAAAPSLVCAGMAPADACGPDVPTTRGRRRDRPRCVPLPPASVRAPADGAEPLTAPLPLPPDAATSRSGNGVPPAGVGGARSGALSARDVPWDPLADLHIEVEAPAAKTVEVTVVPTGSEAAVAARLSVLSGAELGRTLVVGRRAVVLGRGSHADEELVDPAVSRRHALLRVRCGHLEVEDLGSRNGTIVNGLPVQLLRLQLGDHVRIGAVVLQVQALLQEDPTSPEVGEDFAERGLLTPWALVAALRREATRATARRCAVAVLLVEAAAQAEPGGPSRAGLLERAAERLVRAFGGAAIVGHGGPEELCVILRGAGLEEALRAGALARVARGGCGRLPLSVGVAAAHAETAGPIRPGLLLWRARQALALARSLGGGRVCGARYEAAPGGNPWETAVPAAAG